MVLTQVDVESPHSNYNDDSGEQYRWDHFQCDLMNNRNTDNQSKSFLYIILLYKI